MKFYNYAFSGCRLRNLYTKTHDPEKSSGEVRVDEKVSRNDFSGWLDGSEALMKG